MPPPRATSARRLGRLAAVGQHGGDRAEDLVLVDGGGGMRGARQEQGGGEEVSFAGRRAHAVDPAAAGQHLGLLAQPGHPVHGIAQLGGGGQRTHAHRGVGGVAHHGFGEPPAQRFERGVEQGGRHQHPAGGGAFLAGLLGHLARHFLDEEVEGRAAGLGRRAPSTAAFRLSASMLTRGPAASTFGWLRKVRAVSALPVKASTSCGPR